LAGAEAEEIVGVSVDCRSPFETEPEHVKAADGIVIGTTENLAYMAGATKDFFDRCYYPCLEETQGRPLALYIRAGNDGTGTQRAIERIVTGLRWRFVQEPLILRGDWQDSFAEQVEALAMGMAAGLEAGVF